MLILGAQENERIFINDDVKVTLLAAHRGRAKLGFDAPQDQYTIHREKIYRRIQAAKQSNGRGLNKRGYKVRKVRKVAEINGNK